MSEKNIELLSDYVSEAHRQIQQNFDTINPIVGVSRGMRSVGIPADAMTIDCLKTGKRIIIILHDESPEIIQFQFSYKDKDPAEQFQSIAIESLSEETLYNWMATYFKQS